MLDSDGTCAPSNRPRPGRWSSKTPTLKERAKSYSRFKVPGTAYMFPAYDLNRALPGHRRLRQPGEAQEPRHLRRDALAQDCFGTTPASIYGGRRGRGRSQREAHLRACGRAHEGKRQPSKPAPPELHPDSSREPGYRVRALGGSGGRAPHPPGHHRRRRIHCGRRRAWIKVSASSSPACCWRASIRCVPTPWPPRHGLHPRAVRGTVPFRTCDNTLLLAETHGIGTMDLKRIEVRGLPIEQALFLAPLTPFRAMLHLPSNLR